MKDSINKKKILEFLIDVSKMENPITDSAKIISENVMFEREVVAKVIKKKKYWKPSRQNILNNLKKLEEEGKISLDYSDKWNPKITVNRHM